MWKALARWITAYVVIPAALIGATVGVLKLDDYAKHDPSLCASCHQSRAEYSLWTKGEHRSIVCQECHHETQREALRVALIQVFGSRTLPESNGEGGEKVHHPTVDIDACGRCHLGHDPRWPDIGASTGHRMHIQQAKISCMKCHARSVHKFAAASDGCGECHPAHELRTTGMEKVHCLACHNFLTTDDTLRPTQQVCVDCHQAEGLRHAAFPPEAPMAKLVCWACHKPHKAEAPQDVPCVSCHDDPAIKGHAVREHSDCATCHVAHTWLPTNKMCTDCHREHVSHYAHKDCWSCHSFERLEKEGKATGAFNSLSDEGKAPVRGAEAPAAVEEENRPEDSEDDGPKETP